MENTFLPSSMFVYPGPRVSPQGRNNYAYVRPDGTSIPAGRTFHRKAEKRYCFPLSKDGMKINTGLDELIDNPFTNEEMIAKYVKDQWQSQTSMLREKNQITLQTYLEVLHNRPPGFYTNEKKVYRAFDVDAKENTFFESYSVALSDGTNVFTSESIDGQLAMLVMRANSSIANNKNEYNPSLHDFYIGQEHEAAQEVMSKRAKQGRAIATLSNIYDKFDEFTWYQIAIALEVVIGSVNTVSVKQKLDDYLWVQDKNLNARIDKFNSFVKDIESKEGKEKLYLRYVFQQALNTRVISVANGSFIWHSKKGITNLYNLGTKMNNVLIMFYTEMLKYDPTLNADNFYGDLVQELMGKGIKLIENQRYTKKAE